MEKIKIMVNGKQYVVSFSEVTNKELFIGKILSVQDSKDSEHYSVSKEKEMREMEVVEEPSEERELHASNENLCHSKDSVAVELCATTEKYLQGMMMSISYH